MKDMKQNRTQESPSVCSIDIVNDESILFRISDLIPIFDRCQVKGFENKNRVLFCRF